MIKSYNVTVNGNTYSVEVEEVDNIKKREAHLQKPKQSIQRVAPTVPSSAAPQVEQSKPKSPPPSSGSASIESPMPGTINDICVKVGDTVKKDQVLVILEAMKMENEIVSTCNGTVSSISVSKGSAVNAQDVLLSISKTD